MAGEDNKPQDDIIDAEQSTLEFLTQEQMKNDEKAAKKLRAEMAAYDEYLIRGKPEKVEEDEEEFVPTPRQLYNGYSHNGTAFSGYKDNEEISDSRAKFIKNSILKDYLTVTEVANAHAGAVASIMTPEEAAQLGEDNTKKLAEKYVEYYNANPDKVTKDELIAVLNSPIGKDVLDPEKGINLTIDRAEDLIASERVDANNIGKNNNQLRAYALDYTISDANDKILRMRPGKQRTELEQKTVNTSYKYAANSEIMENMKYSSLMGRYALDKVFDGHLENKQGVYQGEDEVVNNVMRDAARNQDNETAVYNYNKVCMEYGRMASNLDYAGNFVGENRTNAPLRDNVLYDAIVATNNQIKPGTKLDTHGHALAENMTFSKSKEMNALQEYIDFSKAYRAQGLSDHYNNPNYNAVKNLKYYDDAGNSMRGRALNDRQAEYAMYICCKKKEESKKKLTPDEKKEMDMIVKKYGESHLKRMYDITSAAHSGNSELVEKKRNEIYKEEGVYIRLSGRMNKYAYEDSIQTKIDNDLIRPIQRWNKVIRKDASPLAQNTASKVQGKDEIDAAFAFVRVQDKTRTPTHSVQTAPAQQKHQQGQNVQDIILRKARENQYT